MDTIVFLITLSAGALAVHYKERLSYFVPRRQTGARVLVDQSLGLARLELPDGWRQAQDLNETASIVLVYGEATLMEDITRVFIISSAIYYGFIFESASSKPTMTP